MVLWHTRRQGGATPVPHPKAAPRHNFCSLFFGFCSSTPNWILLSYKLDCGFPLEAYTCFDDFRACAHPIIWTGPRGEMPGCRLFVVLYLWSSHIGSHFGTYIFFVCLASRLSPAFIFPGGPFGTCTQRLPVWSLATRLAPSTFMLGVWYDMMCYGHGT